MELFERRRYYFCHHCGAFHFIDTAAADGLQPLGPSDKAHDCPVCATVLGRGLLDATHPVEHCAGCGGLLMPRASFGDVVTRRRAWASGPPSVPARLDARELERQLTCPGCRGSMAVHPYYGPGNVVIDTCDRCDVVWVDSGELRQIADAPGRDRGSRGRP